MDCINDMNYIFNFNTKRVKIYPFLGVLNKVFRKSFLIIIIKLFVVEFFVGITTIIPFEKTENWPWYCWCLASFIIFLVSFIRIYFSYCDLKTMELIKKVAKRFENEGTKKDEETHLNQTVIKQRSKNSTNNNDSLQQLVDLMSIQIEDTKKNAASN
jgi:hypothetical protein